MYCGHNGSRLYDLLTKSVDCVDQAPTCIHSRRTFPHGPHHLNNQILATFLIHVFTSSSHAAITTYGWIVDSLFTHSYLGSRHDETVL